MDLSRVDIVNAPTLEAGFKEIYNIFTTVNEQIKKKQIPDPWLVIWDTIAASKPAAEVNAALAGDDPMNAGGMGLKARVNEINLAIVMSNLWGKPVTIFILNQARTAGFGSFTGTYDTSTGGNQLKHTGHYRIAFRKAKKIWDETLMMNVGTMSRVDVEKSKFGPTIGDIPIFIDDRVGGRIRNEEEAAQVLWQMKILNATGGPWYKFNGEDEAYTWDMTPVTEKNGRYVINNPETRKKCIDVLARHFRMQYYTLDIVYRKIGLNVGELNEDQQKTREELTKKFDFARVLISHEKEVSNAKS